MKKTTLIFIFVIGLTIIGWAVDHHRWVIKTKPAFRTNPRKLKLNDIITLADPPGVSMNDKRYERKLIPAFSNNLRIKEGDLVRIEGYMHLVAFEDNDEEYHIQISGSKSSGDNCLIVEVPDPKNVDDATLKQKYQAVRDFIKDKILKGKEPGRSGNVISGNAYVYVTGQLFYDASHTHNQTRGKKGMRSNSLWEIHPIIEMNFAVKS